MGAQISSNRFQSSQKINDLLLKLSINGPLQGNVCNKQISVAIDGFLMENDKEVSNPSGEVVKGFKDFVATPEFKEYLQNQLLVRNTNELADFTFEIPAHTLSKLSWTVEGAPQLSYKDGAFQVTFNLLMSDDTNTEHKMSRAVAFVSKGIMSALLEKRAELIPTLKTKSFAPTHVTFSN